MTVPFYTEYDRLRQKNRRPSAMAVPAANLPLQNN